MSKSNLLLGLFLLLQGCSSMSHAPMETSYLNWKPALSADEVFKNTVSFSYLSVDEKGRLFWIENRPEESGRAAIVMKDLDGQIRDVIPANYSARNRVLEYGSNPYVVFKDQVYFTNMQDQRIYVTSLSQPGSVKALTAPKAANGGLGKYADLNVSPDGHWLIFAYETEYEDHGHEATNEIGILDLRNSAEQQPKILATGANFYKGTQFSPDGKHLAWTQWNHPYMPWNSTQLYTAPFAAGSIRKQVLIESADSVSVNSFCFAPSGEIFYSADFAVGSEKAAQNFYNIYAYKDGRKRTLTQTDREFRSLRCADGKVYAVSASRGISNLVDIDVHDGHIHEQNLPYADYNPLAVFKDKLYFVGFPANRPSELAQFDGKQSLVVRKSSQEQFDPADVSLAQPIEFPTSDGEKAYGFFYPPQNSKYRAPADEKPPVRVLVHGGPIAGTSPGFSKFKMYWTSQGYAIFDVNYRGSVGFGRKYRDALLKKWGLLEIQDVKDGLAELHKRNLISNQAVVSGGSAGGYTVQRLLTFYPDMFAAGASYFGIGNLVTLQKLTHKFESHFLEQLIGGTLDNNAKEYEDRSPINHLEKLKSPMIIFQGSDDKVVPPENSREMAAILKRKGIRYEYYEYPGEDHGFRKAQNLKDSLEKESAFFKSVLKGN